MKTNNFGASLRDFIFLKDNFVEFESTLLISVPENINSVFDCVLAKTFSCYSKRKDTIIVESK